MEQPIAATPFHQRLGPRTTAGIGYAIILIVLFHRLLAGDVLSPGAIIGAMDKTIAQKIVTYDFARLMEGATKVKCSEFGDALIRNL